jgi:hypothetical protein
LETFFIFLEVGTVPKSRIAINSVLLAGCFCFLTGHVFGDEKRDLPQVRLMRVPQGGIQPQVSTDREGAIHLIYFLGNPANGDVYYARSSNGKEPFSGPIRINSTPGSAIAIGNIRGPQLAIGRNDRVHVAWNGSDKAVPRGPHGESPMIYTRQNDAGSGFEPERNIITSAYGLDGGGSVAADQTGNVYVAWHAPQPGAKGEDNRCVWVARSTYEGKTFAPERQAFAEPTGACGCCGMRAFADKDGKIYLLYRAAKERIHRDMFLLASEDKGDRFRGEKLHEWEGGICPMSMESFCQSGNTVMAAWETGEQVYFDRIDQKAARHSAPIHPSEEPKRRKHPVVAGNARGETILAWTEGMGWQKGGSVAWQVFDKEGKPAGPIGRADGVPTWSLVAVFASPDGSFVVVY